MTETVFCKDCEFYPDDSSPRMNTRGNPFYRCNKYHYTVSPYDGACGDFELGKGGEE